VAAILEFRMKEPSIRPSRLETEISFSEENRDEKFLLVYTNAKMVGQGAGVFSDVRGPWVKVHNYPFSRGAQGKLRFDLIGIKDNIK
jgi:hypothetical protein